MDSSNGGANGFGKRDNQNSLRREKPSYKRLSPKQVDILEKFMKECPHPDESQRLQLAAEVGIEPKQIKFWFQNKRTQMKNQHEKEDNNALRIENDNIRNENREMREILKNVVCPYCGGPLCRDNEHEHYVHAMLLENDVLRAKYESVYNFLSTYLGNHMSQPELHAVLSATIGSSSYAPAFANSVNQQAIDQVPILNQNFPSQFVAGDMLLPEVSTILSTDTHKALMIKVATTAMDELVNLMHSNESVWINSPNWDGKFIISHEVYEKIFPMTTHFNGPNIRVESSKGLTVVNMSGMNLVDMFLNSDKWANCFPTIVTKAKTLHVVDNGFLENRSGALKMMYGKMHTMSPLVPAREFCFLRHCQQIGAGKWVIMDVSFDPFGGNNPISHCWRLPSGCMIEEMNTGCSMVTWIEHVEVDDKIQTHPLFNDLVYSSAAFGAERWLKELQRVCERLSLYYIDMLPSHDIRGVINSFEARRSIMNLSHRMVKILCENLIISDKLEFPQLSSERNSGVKICFRKCIEPGQPNGIIIVAVTSLWLPLPYQQVYNFLTDDTKRFQWDVLSYGSMAHKIAQISTRNQPDNSISIIQPLVSSEGLLILQENFIDSIGSYIIYAPLDVAPLNVALKGEDSTLIPILPSGFVISGDGKPNATFGASSSRYVERSGSLLTIALQTLICSLPGIVNLDMESVSKVNDVLTSTTEKIKIALNCTSFE
ncbi:hypothetical protein Lal_00013317 [Lupinus albus]|uniref:Putative transcription factor & lipid binding HD-SAD family n=1 Tax=Lupinus albus TaxID=3870 RepID=A0A6A4P3Q2_LUPAL|nr:putative transcription factor & lipid binding HD-SAD family [Lupinus albus]KAF1890722.1 hypothetical protein Lal_00013317 [Lupinus albus]